MTEVPDRMAVPETLEIDGGGGGTAGGGGGWKAGRQAALGMA